MTHRSSVGAARRAVVEEWRRDPARLRADAAAEGPRARARSRGLVLHALAETADRFPCADGASGSLLLRLTRLGGRPVLLVGLPGAPTSPAEVAGLAPLRVLADEVVLASPHLEARFSLERTCALLAEKPDLAAVLARRGGGPPALCLPFEVEDEAALALARRALAHHAAALVVTLRDERALAATRTLLGRVGDLFLLAHPGLREVTVETPDGAFTVAEADERWFVTRACGSPGPEVVRGLPGPARGRAHWELAWAYPREPRHGRAVPGVLLAPAPTSERLSLPASLLARLPRDRSHARAPGGRVGEVIVGAAARAYGELAQVLVAAGRDPDVLVPSGVPVGDLDARLREAIVGVLGSVPVRPAGEDGRR